MSDVGEIEDPNVFVMDKKGRGAKVIFQEHSDYEDEPIKIK
jgi:hypothetical protein